MGLNLMKGVYLEWNDMEKGNRYAFFRKSIKEHGYLYF